MGGINWLLKLPADFEVDRGSQNSAQLAPLHHRHSYGLGETPRRFSLVIKLLQL